MSKSQAQQRAAAHPAYADLQAAALELRRRLTHALAIEYDWRCHDGPEWAARYWRTFADLADDLAAAAAATFYRAVLARSEWPPLSAAEADDVRTIFRGLLGVVHTEIDPAAANDERAGLWPKILRAYRRGDRRALVAAWSETRALVRGRRLPGEVVALRAERDRLAARLAAAERRLEAMRRCFPFNVRNKLDDPAWVRRQRMALAQVRVLVRPPRGADSTGAMRKQVS